MSRSPSDDDVDVTRVRDRSNPVTINTSEVETQPPAARAAIDIGDELGAYRVLRLLGTGGMGEVYEAEHIESGRRVALKVLARSLGGPESAKRFLREGRLAAAVTHPNSVYVYGSEDVDGVATIAMELVPGGGTLKDLVKREGPLPPTRAVDAILQMVAGLEAAAAVGVLHRDIKPSNCFVDASGVVKIGDYGLSMSTMAEPTDTQLTTVGTFVGTPAYASPEQVSGDAIDLRSDLYSVGATLYFLLTGKPPFVKGEVMHVLAAVLRNDPPSPRTHVPAIPAALAAVVLRCLAKQPSARYARYADLRAALLPFSSQPIEAGSLAMRRRRRELPTRRPRSALWRTFLRGPSAARNRSPSAPPDSSRTFGEAPSTPSRIFRRPLPPP